MSVEIEIVPSLDKWLSTHCAKGESEGSWVVKGSGDEAWKKSLLSSISQHDPEWRLEVRENDQKLHVKKHAKLTLKQWLELNTTPRGESNQYTYKGPIPMGYEDQLALLIEQKANREIKPGHQITCVRREVPKVTFYFLITVT